MMSLSCCLYVSFTPASNASVRAFSMTLKHSYSCMPFWLTHYLSRDLSGAERNTDHDSIPRDTIVDRVWSLSPKAVISGLGGRGPYVTIQLNPLPLPRHLLILLTYIHNTNINRSDGFYSTDVTSTSKYLQQTRSGRYDIH
jgi:hypothetical protein